MRRALVVMGIVVLVVGGVLWYLPLEPVHQGSPDVTKPSYVIGVQAPLDFLGGGVDYEITWHTSSSETIRVYDCGAQANCSAVAHAPLVAQGSGKSVDLKFSAQPSHYYDLVFSALPASVSISYVEPVAGGAGGLAVVIFGAFLLVLGVYLAPLPRESRPRREAPPADDRPGPDEPST